MTLVDLPGIDATGIRADNPGAFTLTGTNSWVLGRDPAWLVDPGPALPDHVAALTVELQRRGGLAGIALTHDHADHSEAVAAMRERFEGVPLAGARGGTDVVLAEGTRFGPLEAVATPGHAPDHFAFVVGTLALTGDAVLGTGSVFIAPDPGALAGYLDGLARLKARRLTLLAPGHGPVVHDPEAKLEEYTSSLRANPLPPARDALCRWRGPARIVWGMKDTFFDPKSADWLDKNLPGSRGIRRLEEANLFFTEEMPDVIAEEAIVLWKNSPA